MDALRYSKYDPTEQNYNSKTIYFYPRSNKDFSAEDLAIISSPFGCVVSVQKIVQNGCMRGLVTYANAIDATVATTKLVNNKDFIVGVLTPEENRGSNNGRSERPHNRPDFFKQNCTNNMLPLKQPNLNILNPNAYSQCVYVRVDNLPRNEAQRYEVVKLILPSSCFVKMEGRSLLVMMPNFYSAIILKDFLRNLYTGSRRLHVYDEHHESSSFFHL